MAPGGRLLVSFPYGLREVLEHPSTHRIGSQVFDRNSLQHALQTLQDAGVKGRAEVYQAADRGWARVAPEACAARYADGCPAAAAVYRSSRGAMEAETSMAASR